jgi:hypothetical protein
MHNMPMEWTGHHNSLGCAIRILPATHGQRYPYQANRAPDAPPGTER